MEEKLRIIFFGTPEFAVSSLDMLVKNGYHVVGIVTAPDKPAGRGLDLKLSAVKEYAHSRNLPVLQPENLKSEEFLAQMRDLNPTLGIVVAFRKLPQAVWGLPALGTFNLHASLLPHYRGAAPINWAIINGEKESGVTTFFLNEEIDTGKIIFRAKENISEEDNAGSLYERLMKDGADLVLKTVRAIESGTYTPEEQASLLKPNEKIKLAPKIFKEDCRINWKKKTEEVYDFVRGLSPYPAAWTEIKKENEIVSLKVFKCAKEIVAHNSETGVIIEDISSAARPDDQIGRVGGSGKAVKISVKNGFIRLQEVQLAGRKKMNIEEFLRGFSFDGWKISGS
ncbi:MAG: methionyl-tRNA formyltransferase [Bacteroidetes bacterium]|nr:MAG: methionyl-tRNA formyltransferase [Bacteroidota bacterium]